MSDDKKAKKSGAAQDTSDLAVAESSPDVSAIFSSKYTAATIPSENKKCTGIIDNYVILFRRSLTGLLGKKVEFAFDSLKLTSLKALNLDQSPIVLSSIFFAPNNQTGLIFFDYPFMHAIIDILFGAGVYKNDTIISSLGKSGTSIAKKIVELCIAALQEAIAEYEKIQINLLKTTEQSGLILNQPLSDQFINLTFHANMSGTKLPFHIAIPSVFFEQITAQDEIPVVENNDPTTVNTTLKKDIIESRITIGASLQDIKLKITDIMNLKSGDLIPILDPTMVYMTHNQKKIFRGSVGQSNAQRVVKIIDPL